MKRSDPRRQLCRASHDQCCAAIENVTMLHQLGIRHEGFTYEFQGLDAKLTGVEPSQVITDILA